MKSIFVVLNIGCLLASLSAQAQDRDSFPQFTARTYRDGDQELKYRLLVPKSYEKGKALPLIVWLHGSGEKGTNNSAQLQGLERTVLSDAEKCPAVVLAPQCPSDSSWLAVGYNKPAEIPYPARLTIGAVREVQKELGLDERRLYLGGFSMGGCGTWDILSRYPDLFAAAFPIAGPPGDREALAPVIKNVPTWIFHGDQDRVAPVEMSRAIAAQLKEAGCAVKYTEYSGGGHECLSTLRDPELLKWLLAQQRETAPNYELKQVPTSAALIVKTLPDGEKGTWTGKAERTGRGAPRLAINNVRYRLRVPEKADAEMKSLLMKLGQGEVTGNIRVTGVVELSDYAWIVVEKVEVVE